jgi:Zn-dependent peptidase ImmA (M78 family)
MMDDMPREEVVAVLDQIVRELLDQAGTSGPPIDAIALAQKHLGMTVSLDSRQQQRGRVQRAGKKPQIFLRPEPTEERHQWSVAHEIAHHFKSQIHERLNLDADEAKALTGESLANLFSSRLLVPTLWFRHDADELGYDLLELKKRYSTASHQVIALRFLDLVPPTVVTIIDNDEIHRRKSNGPRFKAKELEPAEKKCWEAVKREGKPVTVSEAAWTVQGWPIHQADWKREILRSVVEEGI